MLQYRRRNLFPFHQYPSEVLLLADMSKKGFRNGYVENVSHAGSYIIVNSENTYLYNKRARFLPRETKETFDWLDKETNVKRIKA